MKTKFLFLSICLLFIELCSGQAFDNYQKTWATYFGPSGSRFNFAETDSQDNLIAVGQVYSMEYIGEDPDYYNQFVTSEEPEFQINSDFTSIGVIAKFSPEGELLWSGYFPFDILQIKIDEEDQLYITGIIQDATIGTEGSWAATPFDSLAGYSSQLIALKLNPDFTTAWVSYLPITSYAFMDIDEEGSMYCAGGTPVQENITTEGVFQPEFMEASANGYLVKLDSQGQMQWGTYLGTATIPSLNSSKNGVILSLIPTGEVAPNFYTTTNAYQSTPTSKIISIFNPMSGTLTYGTYIDSNLTLLNLQFLDGYYYGFGYAHDEFTDENLISADAFQTENTNGNAHYLGKFDSQMTPVWGTYIDNPEYFPTFFMFSPFKLAQQALYISIPSDEDAFFDTTNSYQSENNGAYDLAVLKFSLDGNLIWGSLFGGEGSESIGSIGVVSDDTFYLTGDTSSYEDIALPGAYQENLDKHPSLSQFYEYPNGFLAKFSPENMDIPSLKTSGIFLYPNPTSGLLHLSSENEISNYTLYDLSGRILQQGKPQGDQIDLSQFSAGSYILQLKNTKGVIKNVKVLKR